MTHRHSEDGGFRVSELIYGSETKLATGPKLVFQKYSLGTADRGQTRPSDKFSSSPETAPYAPISTVSGGRFRKIFLKIFLGTAATGQGQTAFSSHRSEDGLSLASLGLRPGSLRSPKIRVPHEFPSPFPELVPKVPLKLPPREILLSSKRSTKYPCG